MYPQFCSLNTLSTFEIAWIQVLQKLQFLIGRILDDCQSSNSSHLTNFSWNLFCISHYRISTNAHSKFSKFCKIPIRISSILRFLFKRNWAPQQVDFFSCFLRRILHSESETKKDRESETKTDNLVQCQPLMDGPMKLLQGSVGPTNSRGTLTPVVSTFTTRLSPSIHCIAASSCFEQSNYSQYPNLTPIIDFYIS